jgi:hypothetical protein
VGIDAHKNDHHVYLINEGDEKGCEWVVTNHSEIRKIRIQT